MLRGVQGLRCAGRAAAAAGGVASTAKAGMPLAADSCRVSSERTSGTGLGARVAPRMALPTDDCQRTRPFNTPRSVMRRGARALAVSHHTTPRRLTDRKHAHSALTHTDRGIHHICGTRPRASVLAAVCGGPAAAGPARVPPGAGASVSSACHVLDASCRVLYVYRFLGEGASVGSALFVLNISCLSVYVFRFSSRSRHASRPLPAYLCL